MKEKDKDIYLVDGNSLCYRAYYAIRELTTSKGEPTNAVYGFVNMLRKLVREYEPEMLTVVFDSKGPTVRHEKYEDYKVHREPMPDDLVDQMSKIKDIIDAYNIPIFELEGYEADDIIATLAVKARKKGLNVTIVTSDKDALQLVDEQVRVLSPHPSGDKVYYAREVKEKYGVGPESIVELMALTGDASDNVPGVKGVGQVTASKLINKYGSVKKIYDGIGKVEPESVRKKLAEGQDDALLSRELVVLDTKVPVKFDAKKAALGEPDTERLAELFKELEFGKFLREIAPAKEKERGNYSTADDDEQLAEAVDKIKKAGMTAVRVAVTGQGDVAGISLSWQEGRSVFVPFGSKGAGRPVKDLLEDPKVKIAGHDLKKDLLTLKKQGIELKGMEFDVMVAAYLLDPSLPKFGLADITMRRLGYGLSTGGAEWDSKEQSTMDFTDKRAAGSACEESDAILRLYGILAPELKKKKLQSLFSDVEMPLVKVIAEMEEEGVGIDVKVLKELTGKMEKKLDAATDKIYSMAGEEFNINSPKQLQVILYEKLGLPTIKKTKTGFSTDESVLMKLAAFHELPKMLIEYREMNKLKTGYYDSILGLADKRSGKLYAHFNQAVTATGRLSSSDPNLQNIPIKTAMGREIRRVFTPGEKGYLLLAADYSQVELRILAHLSGDERLIEAFRDEEDVHRFTASLIFDCGMENVTDEMRSTAKTVNFGIVYGMSSFGLAKDLGIGVDEAQKFIDAYFKRYKGVKAFIDRTIKEARKTGFVTTILNRRRYIPEITSSNERVKAFAERVAVNTPVQGSAADLIKLAMIGCHEKFGPTDVKMLIQVHDELVFKVPKKDVKEAAAGVKKVMENVIKIKVPLEVDIEAGTNWLDMEAVEFDG